MFYGIYQIENEQDIYLKYVIKQTLKRIDLIIPMTFTLLFR